MTPGRDKAYRIAQNNGAVAVQGNRFSGNLAVRDLVVLEQGDHVLIDSDAPILSIPMRGRTNEDGSPVTYEGVYARITRNGQELWIAVTPSLFSRSAAPSDSEGNPLADTPRHRCDGTAVEAFFASGESLTDQFHNVCDREIVVDQVRHGYSYNPRYMDEPQQRAYYTLNFVPQAAATTPQP